MLKHFGDFCHSQDSAPKVRRQAGSVPSTAIFVQNVLRRSSMCFCHASWFNVALSGGNGSSLTAALGFFGDSLGTLTSLATFACASFDRGGLFFPWPTGLANTADGPSEGLLKSNRPLRESPPSVVGGGVFVSRVVLLDMMGHARSHKNEFVRGGCWLFLTAFQLPFEGWCPFAKYRPPSPRGISMSQETTSLCVLHMK